MAKRKKSVTSVLLYVPSQKSNDEINDESNDETNDESNDGAQLSETKRQSDKDPVIVNHAAVSVEDDDLIGLYKVEDYLNIIQSLRSTLQYFQDLLKDKDELIECQRNIINTMRMNHTKNENATSRNVCIEESSSSFCPEN